MPSTYAHYRFGKEIYKRLPEDMKKSVDVSPELFAIGQHGPDILFYYSALKSNTVNGTGYGMHAKPASDFFGPALKILEETGNDEGERAYIYGFICHFMLDSCVHWYVEDAISETGVSHTGIEGDFDRMLMERDGEDPVKYMTACHIVPSQENARIIAKFFPEIPQEDILKALKDMIFYSKLLRCPGRLKRGFILTGLKVMGHIDTIGGMVITPKARPQCVQSTAVLDKLFAVALDEAERYLAEFKETLEAGKPLPERFSRTFGPDEESKKEYEIFKA